MWIFLNDAFLSVVADKDPDCLLVRGRIKGDIERVFPGYLVLENEGTDYRFRTVVPRRLVADRLSDMAEDISYKNFKGSVKDKVRHDAYLRCWANMEAWQSDAEAKERTTKARKQPDPQPVMKRKATKKVG